MRSIRLIPFVALLSVATACSRDTSPTSESGGESPSTADVASSRTADTAQRGRQASTPAGQLIDGPIARDPGFHLPVPGASPPGQGSPEPALLDPDTVRLALLEGMPASGQGIRVQADQRGVVSLRGEVATVADRQRAHYLARAQPGVAEVDIEGLRVQQR